jgi:hypothetical protein
VPDLRQMACDVDKLTGEVLMDEQALHGAADSVCRLVGRRPQIERGTLTQADLDSELYD